MAPKEAARKTKPASGKTRSVGRLDDSIAAAREALRGLRGDLGQGRKAAVKSRNNGPN
jgi:hypothetical protein